MASLMNMIGRTFGTIGSTADMLGSGVTYLNDRMKRYASEEEIKASKNSAKNLAEFEVSLAKEMISLTKEMDALKQDDAFEASQQWLTALEQQIKNGDPAVFPGITKKTKANPPKQVTVRNRSSKTKQ